MQRSATLLIVDDEESVRGLLQQVLEGAGYQVVTAANGREALDRMRQQEVALVLLDIKMPGISGVEVLHTLGEEYPDTSVIMVTAMVDVQTAVDAMKMGAYDYIAKPFNLEDMVAKVQKALERRGQLLQEKQRQHNLEQRVGEQTVRLQAQFAELVQSMAREHQLLYGLEAARRSKHDKPALSSLPPELQKPLSSVEEFRDALLRILRRAEL